MPRPGGGPPMGQKADFAAERLRMVERLVASRYIQDPRVRDAFLGLPREAFVWPEEADHAYDDVPLPIRRGHTMSAPSMIAIMLEEARLAAGDRVLEIGTGSGYHAALVAHMLGPQQVVSIERISRLAEWARSNLARAGLSGVTVVVGDGSLGYPERGPYDVVMATAGSPEIPEPWRLQLTSRGRIVAPIGPRSGQVLIVATRNPDGSLDLRGGSPCALLPLVGPP